MVSTVVLIMIVIIIAIIILLWYQGFQGEQILKFSGGAEKPIENVCSEVSIRSFVNEDSTSKSFGFHNIGNVPIYSINLKITNTDGTSTTDEIGSERGGKVDIGLSTVFKDEDDSEKYYEEEFDEVKIIPVLLGKTQSGMIKPFPCPENTGVIV